MAILSYGVDGGSYQNCVELSVVAQLLQFLTIFDMYFFTPSPSRNLTVNPLLF